MKKSIVRLLLGLIILAAVLIIIGKGAAAMLDERVSDALHGVAERYGLEIRYDAVSFVSLRGVTISGLEASFPDGDPIVKAGSLRMVVDLWALLAGRPALMEIVASDVRMIARRDATGQWELQKIRRRSRGASGEVSESRIQWPLALRIDDLTLTVAVPGDSASDHFEYVEAELDLPGRVIVADLRNDGEKLHVRATHESESIRIDYEADNFRIGLGAALVSRLIDLSVARVSGTGIITAKGGEMFCRIGGVLKDISINHAMLSRSEASGIAFGFDLDLYAKNDLLLVRRAALELGGETVIIGGTVARLTDKPVVNVRAEFDHLDLGRVIAAIPRSLVPRLPSLAASGTLTGKFSFYFDAVNPDKLDYGFQGSVDSFTILALAPDIDIEALNHPFIYEGSLPGGETHAIFLGPENPDFTPFASIPRHLVGAVLTAEDGSFFSHNGFSPRHIHDAMIENLKAGRVVRGASTISMQLAKNLFLTRERTLSRKIEEALITFALEQDLEKKRLLEIYLNIIEWGPRVYGIGAASHYYFGKPASSLGPIESAFLASIIARPTHGWSQNPLAHIGQGWWSYLRVILCKMYRRGDVSVETLRQAGVSDTQFARFVGPDTTVDLSITPAPDATGPPRWP